MTPASLQTSPNPLRHHQQHHVCWLKIDRAVTSHHHQYHQCNASLGTSPEASSSTPHVLTKNRSELSQRINMNATPTTRGVYRQNNNTGVIAKNSPMTSPRSAVIGQPRLPGERYTYAVRRLYSHSRSRHQPGPMASCTICGKHFTRSSSVRRHMRGIHQLDGAPTPTVPTPTAGIFLRWSDCNAL